VFDTNDTTTSQKVSSALGSIISGISFGKVDVKSSAKFINDIISNESKQTPVKHAGENHRTKPITVQKWSNMKRQLTEDGGLTPQFKPIDVQFDNLPINRYNVTNKYVSSQVFRLNQVKKEAVDNLQPDMLNNLKNMGVEYSDIFGQKIQINSAYRTVSEQAKLRSEKGKIAAMPGKSMHNYGLAVDMETKDANRAISAGLFDKYGFVRPLRNETWHVEPSNVDRTKIRESTPHLHKTTLKTSANKTETGLVQTLEPKPQAIKKIDLPVEVNKIKNEQMIYDTNEQLVKHTVKLNNQSEQISAVLQPLINNNLTNINTKQDMQRSLSLF